MSAAYGGALQVDQRVASNDALNYPLVLLGSGSLELQFRAAPPVAGSAWTHYDIPLLAAAGWKSPTVATMPTTNPTRPRRSCSRCSPI